MNKIPYTAENTIITRVMSHVSDPSSDYSVIRFDDNHFKILVNNACYIIVAFNGDIFTRIYYKDSELSGGTHNADCLYSIADLMAAHQNSHDEEKSRVYSKFMAIFEKALYYSMMEGEKNLDNSLEM